MRQATNIGKEQLLLLGTCFGKFTKNRNFRLHITALDFSSPTRTVQSVVQAKC